MQTVHYRRWAPTQSPVKIEFPASLVREIRSETEQDHERGTLFGTVTNPPGSHPEFRALASRRDYEPSRVAGMELVGVYFHRARGEVFLTDDDLQYMELLQVRMALVIAGFRAGFFVRQPDESIQTIRSYEEFSVAEVAHRSEPLARPPAAPPAPPEVRSLWRSFFLVAALLAIPAAGVAFIAPLLEDRPIPIAVKESGGHLVATWAAVDSEHGGRLEITDAGVRTNISVAAGASSAVYQPRPQSLIGNQGFTNTVMIRLSIGTRAGSVVWSAPPRTATAEEVRSGAVHPPDHALEQLRQQVQQLRWLEAANNTEIVELSKRAERLENPKNRAAEGEPDWGGLSLRGGSAPHK